MKGEEAALFPGGGRNMHAELLSPLYDCGECGSRHSIRTGEFPSDDKRSVPFARVAVVDV
jgi:hypothetical protein